MIVKKLDSHVGEMKRLATLLANYSYPKGFVYDEDIACLKQRQIVVDGYEVIVYFSKSDYGGMFIYMLSITGKYFPVLPFNVVCKIAQRFLGSKSLSLMEYTQDKHKVYTWMLMTTSSEVPITASSFMDPKKDSKFIKKNGIEFIRMNVRPKNL